MPVYRVTLEGKKHIVIANLGSQAIRHVVKKLVTCETITAEELASEIADGYRIEKADTQAADPFVPAITGEPYNHKPACGASGTVPIGVPPCKCLTLDL